MQQRFPPRGLLTQAALASTLFVSHVCFAVDTTISTVINPATSYDTSVRGNITITNTGRLNMTSVDDAIEIDNSSKTVTLNSDTVSNDAIVTSGLGKSGIKISAAQATVTIGENRNITALDKGIDVQVAGKDAKITNAGKIKSSTIGIDVRDTGAVITNTATGKVEATNEAIKVSVIADDAVINNSGTLKTTSAGKNAVALGADFTLTNNAGGIIQSKSGASAVAITGLTKGTITNFGTMDGGTGKGIDVSTNDFTGQIINNKDGVIKTTIDSAINITKNVTSIDNAGGTIQSLGASGKGIHVHTNDVALTINNTNGGIIEAKDHGTAILLVPNSKMTGNINNSATIQSDLGKTIDVSKKLVGSINNNAGGIIQALGATGTHAIDVGNAEITGKIKNAGTIESKNGSAIFISNSAGKITGGIENSGNLIGQPDAVDLSNATNTITFTQNGGEVQGNLLLSAASNPGETTLVLNGGTITGDVKLTGVNNNVVTVTGGSVQGELETSPSSHDTINVSGGILGKITSGGVTKDTLNILGNFTTGGDITKVETIKVSNPGTQFTIQNLVVGVDTNFNTSVGTTTFVKNNVSGQGSVTNAGTMEISNDKTIKLTNNDFTNAGTLILKKSSPGINNLEAKDFKQAVKGATLTVELSDDDNFGKMVLSDGANTTLAAGSNLKITLAGDGFVPDGATFEVIKATNAIDAKKYNPTFVPPNSVVLSFKDNLTDFDKKVTITAKRLPYETFTKNTITEGVAKTLDLLAPTAAAGDPDLLSIVAQLDTIATEEEMQQALSSLAPVSDYGLIQASHNLTDQALRLVEHRLDDHRYANDVYVNYVAGDFWGLGTGLPYLNSAWVKIFGMTVDQKFRKGVEGFDANATGILIGSDWRFGEQTIMGAAFGYALSDVTSGLASNSTLDIDSFHFMGYASYDFQIPWYVDLLAGVNVHNYNSRRHIHVGEFSRTAIAQYDAWEYVGKLDSGYMLHFGKYGVAPVVSVKYSHLDIDNYTEATAGGVNLAVQPTDVDQLLLSAGVKLTAQQKLMEATYVPELRLMIDYDVFAAKQQSLSNFTGGGASFATQGAKPADLSYHVGLGLNVYTRENILFVMDYDLELRDQYVGHAALLKLQFHWG